MGFKGWNQRRYDRARSCRTSYSLLESEIGIAPNMYEHRCNRTRLYRRPANLMYPTVNFFMFLKRNSFVCHDEWYLGTLVRTSAVIPCFSIFYGKEVLCGQLLYERRYKRDRLYCAPPSVLITPDSFLKIFGLFPSLSLIPNLMIYWLSTPLDILGRPLPCQLSNQSTPPDAYQICRQGQVHRHHGTFMVGTSNDLVGGEWSPCHWWKSATWIKPLPWGLWAGRRHPDELGHGI